MKQVGNALTWGLWAGLLAGLAHALGGAPVTAAAWVLLPLAATGLFWLASYAPGRIWNRLVVLALFQWAAHFVLSSLHHGAAGSGLHVHGGVQIAAGPTEVDLGSAMLVAHALATVGGIIVAVVYGPASRRLLASVSRIARPRAVPAWSAAVVRALDIIWNDLRDAVCVSGRAPPRGACV